MTTATDDREEVHAAYCEGNTPHSIEDCHDYGWDEEGIYIKDVRPATDAEREATAITCRCGYPVVSEADLDEHIQAMMHVDGGHHG